MSGGPEIERRYRGLSREELGGLIRQEAREALRIVTPEIKPGVNARRPEPRRSERSLLNWTARAVPRAAVVRIPHEPADPAKALIARRESICARCEHFNGICTLVFRQVKGCRSLNRYRPGWLAWLAEPSYGCLHGNWATVVKG